MNLSNYTVLDIESTITCKGHPFTPSNRLMAIGILRKSLTSTIKKCYNIERSAAPYHIVLKEVQEILDSTEWLVGFNIKFDLHWLRRYGIKIPDNIKIWDVQLAHHIINHQLTRLPSLDSVSTHYNNPLKLDHIKTNYWDKGIDTDKVPWNELEEYLVKDLEVTEANLISQFNDKSITLKKEKLIKLAGLDLLALEEMEWNGLIYDYEQSSALSKDCDQKIRDINSRLDSLIGSRLVLNYASNDHKSIILYGGTLNETIKTPYIKKDGNPSETRTVSTLKTYIYPRLVVPPKGSDLAKAGFYSTDEGTLSKIKASGKARGIIELFLEKGKIDRLNGTYYAGIPKLIDTMGWSNNILHGNLNQCIAITGRLSSDKPNLQNNPEEVDKLFRSRYEIKS